MPESIDIHYGTPVVPIYAPQFASRKVEDKISYKYLTKQHESVSTFSIPVE